MRILETHDLVHSFSKEETVLNGVSLNVEEGSIYGFLGPNGAGKTTTLRLTLGLLRKQQGSISIFGKDLATNRVSVLRDIGSTIESPSIYSHLTAVENLRVLQRVYRCSKRRVVDVLELVGLADTGKKKAGEFSLGMKQRLSIAIAMLNQPKLLILDEPTNGLDPNGIIEVRELLRRLNQESGITILISSHLLAEIDRLVTHIGIINKGQLMFQGTLEELKQKQQQSLSIILETSDPEKTREVLSSIDLTANFQNGKCILPALQKERVAEINRQLIARGVDVFELSIVKNDLEKIFIDLINE